VVEVEHRITVVQGLPSPVRARRGLAPIPPGGGVSLLVTAGVAFAEEQLTERGWFLDTDAITEVLESVCAGLETAPWTELFPFRPTFELVARDLWRQLAGRLPQLCFVGLRDETYGVSTRYTPPTGPWKEGWWGWAGPG
jgi:6-pyruvoyltetrahydropterin/6-carboxytetrahydropterin synthase